MELSDEFYERMRSGLSTTDQLHLERLMSRVRGHLGRQMVHVQEAGKAFDEETQRDMLQRLWRIMASSYSLQAEHDPRVFLAMMERIVEDLDSGALHLDAVR